MRAASGEWREAAKKKLASRYSPLTTQILIGIEAEYLDRSQALEWADEAQQLGRMLGALIKRHRQK